MVCGWWEITAHRNDGKPLTEADLEHIAEQIKQGFTSGETGCSEAEK